MQNFDTQDLQLSLNPKTLKPLFKINSSRHAVALVFDWIIIFLSIYFSATCFNIFTYFLAIIIIGARMHAMAILMHDATHYRFLKNRKWNDLLTNIFTMYPLFLTIDNYRDNHLAHHKHLNTEEDPDWVSKLPKKEFQFPKTKKEFILGVLSYFLLIQGVKDALWFMKRFNVVGGKDSKPAKKGSLLSQLTFYVVLIIVLTVFLGGPYSYYIGSFLIFRLF